MKFQQTDQEGGRRKFLKAEKIKEQKQFDSTDIHGKGELVSIRSSCVQVLCSVRSTGSHSLLLHKLCIIISIFYSRETLKLTVAKLKQKPLLYLHKKPGYFLHSFTIVYFSTCFFYTTLGISSIFKIFLSCLWPLRK